MKSFTGRSNTRLLVLCFVEAFSTIEAKSQPGSLDTEFGNNGIAATKFPIVFHPPEYGGLGTKSSGANTAALQPDGKILVAASMHFEFSGDSAILRRYNPDGSIDSSFGANGFIYFTDGYAGITGILAEPQGSIVISYVSEKYGHDLYRFFGNGLKDTSFHPLVPVAYQYTFSIEGVKLQPDGKIIAAGYTDYQEFFFIRYLSDGTLDSTFGVNGVVETPQWDDKNYYNNLSSFALQPDGKLVACGYGQASENTYFFVTRYLSNGTIDSSFGINGNVHTIFDNKSYCRANDIVVLENGKIIAGGFCGNDPGCGYLSCPGDTSTNFALVRYLENGKPDKSFGTKGLVQTDFNTYADVINSITPDEQGRIIAAGFAYKAGTKTDIVLARYSDNGVLDSSFGSNGKVTTDVGDKSTASKVIFSAGKKIIVAGGIYNFAIEDSSTVPYIIVARYLADDNILPLSIISFSAISKEIGVSLTWKAIVNNNSQYFVVEKSNNSTSFTEIGSVASKGVSGFAQEYNYFDKQPFLGKNYYRLKQIDANGEINYSKTVVTDFSSNASVYVYPNPVKNYLTIRVLNNTAKTSVSITDLSGRVVITATTSSNNLVIPTSKLAPGTYYVTLQQGQYIFRAGFVKD